MRIAHKLALCTIVPLVLLALVRWRTYSIAQESLTDVIQTELSSRGNMVMGEVDRTVARYVAEWQSYSVNAHVVDTLKASNRRFSAMQDLESYLERCDGVWRAAVQGEGDSMLEALLDEACSSSLATMLAKMEEVSGYSVYGEVFITNRFGANLARVMMKRTLFVDDELGRGEEAAMPATTNRVDNEAAASVESPRFSG